MIGDIVGSYRIIGTYPHGGFRAVDVADCTRVHLEVANTTEDWRERAIQHLRAASIVNTLDHPGIARIHGRGVLPDRRTYVASELADGIPLSDVLARRALTVDEAVSMIRDLTELVAHAHAHGVLHGQLRPNLVTVRTGDKPFQLQLGGWGDLCAPGPIVNLPPALTAYMAPELVRGTGTIDGKIDVYAIGAVIYRGLTGRFPGMLAPEHVANVPGPVSALVVRMLALEPAARITALEALSAATQLSADRVLGGPRFSRPRWTPAPLPDGERVANIIDFAAARRDRS